MSILFFQDLNTGFGIPEATRLSHGFQTLGRLLRQINNRVVGPILIARIIGVGYMIMACAGCIISHQSHRCDVPFGALFFDINQVLAIHRHDQIERFKFACTKLPCAQFGKIIPPGTRRAGHGWVNGFAQMPITCTSAVGFYIGGQRPKYAFSRW